MAKFTEKQAQQLMDRLSEGMQASGSVPMGGGGGLFAGVTPKKIGKFGGGFLAWWLLDKLVGSAKEREALGTQREAIRAQAEMASPESLYYQAALPRAQEEEQMARRALMGQLSGGVLGPSLARGERIVGGR